MSQFRKFLRDRVEKDIGRLLEPSALRAAEGQSVVESFVVWCLKESGRPDLEEALRKLCQAESADDRPRDAQRSVIASLQIISGGVDLAVEDAFRALVKADWTDPEVDVDEVVTSVPGFREEVLPLARMGVERAFGYLSEQSPGLDTLAREVDHGLMASRWGTLLDLDGFLRERLEPLVGRGAVHESNILATEVAWRCAYWRLIRNYRGPGSP